ncbi:MAG: LacI family DNA-binding transcriptional regulator [Pseudomonadota bacterium]
MSNIKDIAAAAGVSIATVSRALRRPDVVTEKTAKKIRAAIEELDYKPNMLAASLRKRRADAVIVAVPDIYNPFTSTFVQGIENVARENGIKVMLGLTEGRRDLLDRHYEMVAGKQADGLILLDINRPSVIDEHKPGDPPLPIVLACEYEDGIDLPRVRVDNVEAAALAAAHIAGLGHRRIACVSGPPTQRMSRDRQRGFRLGLRRAGLTITEELMVAGDYSVQAGVAAVESLLSQGLSFTALMCENDEMAIGAIHALAARGLSVPQDVSVTGIDNLRFAEFANPGLTTIALPTMQIGEQAMRLMLDYHIDPESAGREIVVPHELVVRASTGPVSPAG